MARTERYLPVQSRVVVQNGVPAHWYTTVRDVVIPTGEDTSAQCPLSGTDARTVMVAGVRIWYQPRMVRSRIVLEDGDVDTKTFDEQFSLFHYDVPNRGDSAGYSPCRELYRVAVRLTESAWLVKTGDVPYDLMGRMQDIGCLVYCNKFDRTETRSLMLQSVAQLQSKMDEATTDAEQSYHRAMLQLTNSSDPEHREYEPDETKATERFTKRTALIEKRLTDLAKDIQTGAAKFGISTKSYGHDRLYAMATLTHSRTRQQAQSYHRGTVALSTSTDTTAHALATSAAASELPVEVMADALREAGDDATADALTETFSLIEQGEDE